MLEPLWMTDDGGEDIVGHLPRRLIRIDVRATICIVVDQLSCAFLVGSNASMDDVVAGIIQPALFERPLADAYHEFASIWTGKMEKLKNVDMLLQQLSLFNIARDPIEHQDVNVRLEHVQHGPGVNLLLEIANRELIGDESSRSGIGNKLLPDGCPRIHGAKGVTHGEMIESRNGAEDCALCAFATAGSTEENEGFIAVKGSAAHGRDRRLVHKK